MKKRLLGLLLVVTFSLPAFASVTGTGSDSDPYIISSVADFDQWRLDSSMQQSGSYTELAVDLDLQGVVYSGFITSSYYFRGVLDGCGHKIENITLTNCYGGLFREMYGGTVKNLSLVNMNISGSDYASGIANIAWEASRVENCYVNCTINSSSPGLTGLISANYGIIENCGTDVDITSSSGVTWTNCSGFVGSNWGTITNCYAKGSVSGNIWNAGFAIVNGHNQAPDMNGTITNCYCNVAIYSATVLASNYGFVVDNYTGSTINNSFWNNDTAPSLDTARLAGTNTIKAIPTEKMNDILTYLSAGWDFSGEGYNGTEDIWTILPNESPILTWQAGTYCIDQPYFDTNGDCLVDLRDFAVFAQEWLTCGYAYQPNCPY